MSSLAGIGNEQKCTPERNLRAGTPGKGTSEPHGSVAPGDEPRYLESTFRAGALTQAILTAAEVAALKCGDVDFHFDQVFGRISIRRPNGEVREFDGEIPGLGPDVGLRVLDNILWAMGETLTIQDFNGLLDDDWVRSSRTYCLRQAFGDTPALGWYFIVKPRPWRIRWNLARSWRLLEKLARPTPMSKMRETA